MSRHILKPLIGFGTVINIVILDQLTKWWITEHVLKSSLGDIFTQPMGIIDWIMNAPERLQPIQIEVMPHFNLVMVWNEGISFGLLHGANAANALIAFSLAVTFAFSVWLMRSRAWSQTLGLSMVIGGALGNVIDRFRFGAVADFLDFYYEGWHWPAFNLADSAITVGVAFLVVDVVFFEGKRNNASRSQK